MSVDLFVGRREELQGALATLQAAGDGTVEDLIGVHGIGKTMFLERLADEARGLDRVQVFTFDMARHGLGGQGFFDDFGSTATAQVLWATFDCSRRLMRRLVDQAGTDGFNRFRLAYQQQSRLADSFFVKTDVSLGRGSHFEDNEIVSAVSLGDEYVRQRIREMQSALDEAFVTDWAAYTRHRRVLITADTFQGVADDEMGHWMARMPRRYACRTLCSCWRARRPRMYSPIRTAFTSTISRLSARTRCTSTVRRFPTIDLRAAGHRRGAHVHGRAPGRGQSWPRI